MVCHTNVIGHLKILLTCFFLTVARGVTVLAKSVTESRIKDNLKIVDLSSEDLEELSKVPAQLTQSGEPLRYVYPPFGINFGFPDKSEGKSLKNGTVA